MAITFRCELGAIKSRILTCQRNSLYQRHLYLISLQALEFLKGFQAKPEKLFELDLWSLQPYYDLPRPLITDQQSCPVTLGWSSQDLVARHHIRPHELAANRHAMVFAWIPTHHTVQIAG
jgi:hypothetical protein